jgi:hypothetical protein
MRKTGRLTRLSTKRGEGGFLILECDDGYMHRMRGAGVAGAEKSSIESLGEERKKLEREYTSSTIRKLIELQSLLHHQAAKPEIRTPTKLGALAANHSQPNPDGHSPIFDAKRFNGQRDRFKLHSIQLKEAFHSNEPSTSPERADGSVGTHSSRRNPSVSIPRHIFFIASHNI